MGIYTADDKLMTLPEAIKKYVNDGDMVAFSGGLILREPSAAIHELIRQKKRNLHIVGTAHGFDVDLACGGGIAKTIQYTYVAYEFVYRGGCPNYRRAVENKQVELKENCCYSVIQGLRAAAYGLPHMPAHFMFGTDELKLHPEIKHYECPVTGRKLAAIPPIKPDVAILHVYKADKRGNATVGPPLVADVLFSRAADKVILTAEEIVPTGWFEERQAATIPYFETTAVVHVPFGAHPTACYLYYTYDKEFLDEYIEYARGGQDMMDKWLNKYVYECDTHEKYLKAIGGDAKLEKLKNWRVKKEEAEKLKKELEAKWTI
jgi:glutaconate CoA-transferase subunit A